MSCVLIVIFFLNASWALAQSQAGHAIDRQIDTCLSKNASILGMIACHSEGLKSWEMEMNKVYYQLLSKITDISLQNLLKEEQSTWEQMRQLEHHFDEKFYAHIGAEWLVVAASARVDAVRQRTLRLREYYYLLEKKSNK
ncbi:MAG: DUF1311 domain-containing protein [Cytophagales bacterium]|nr:DUF1311 domain-containing protein [Cytophagales bacterium]MDW8385138.1 lysozyme inhibitor LprI family protein [Flammeovirgaceae bacterium]